MTERESPLERWRRLLAAREIPADLRAGSAEPARPRAPGHRAKQQRETPQGLAFDRAWETLHRPGSVLDVGSGAGGSSLPLAPRATSLTAVDPDTSMLEALAEAAGEAGLPVSLVPGRWPEAGDRVGSADVVVCHHVLYAVTELEPFVSELTAHARRRVVLEMTVRPPQSGLDPLWERFYGLRRPDGPTADDAVAALRSLGLDARAQTWTRPSGMTYESFVDLVEAARRKLSLPAGQHRRVADALRESGVVPDVPETLSLTPRELVTIWWEVGNGHHEGAGQPHRMTAKPTDSY